MDKFDRNFARLLLEICRYTYAAGFSDKANADDLQDSLKWIKNYTGLPATEPILLKGSDTSVACITAYPDRNIVSYMGTKTQFNSLNNATASIKDWSQNFEALLVPFKLTSEQLGAGHPTNINKDDLGGRVHKGFLDELVAVQSLIVAELQKRGGRNRPVYVTGHSQGGAEAALATRALLAGGFPVTATYTFAAPRSGNADFAKTIPATLPVHRIEFGDDIVPHVPPALITKEMQQIAEGLKSIPFLNEYAKMILNVVLGANTKSGFAGIGKLCYGSQKTQAMRVDLTLEQEAALFYDRLWSLVRHPERWAEHHHLAGTTEEVKNGTKGNYTALISDFSLAG